MKYKKFPFWILTILFISLACQLPNPFSKKPEVIHHPRIEAQEVDLTPFQNLGCAWQERGYAQCEKDSVAERLGCQSLYKPKNYFSLLNPQQSIVRCFYSPGTYVEAEVIQTEAIYNDGCSMQMFARLLTYQDGNYHLIKNKEELKNSFAPIENEGEALAYLLASRDVSPMFDFDPPEEYEYFLDPIEETYIEKTADGFQILVYHYALCGCGDHPTYQEIYLVTESGEIQLLESNPAYANPEGAGMCVD